MVLRGVVGDGVAKTIVALALLGAAASPSRAAEESPAVAERRAAAGRLADEGYDLLAKNECEEARAKFREADDTLHSPMFVVFVARAEQCLGRLVEAQAHLRGVLEENLADYAPDSFWQAKREAQKELAALQARLPTWSLRVTGASRSELTLKLDGRTVDVPESGAALPVDPGRHQLEAESLDGRRAEERFTAREGDRLDVELEFGGGPGGGGSNDQPPEGGEGWWSSPYLPAGVAYGLGGAGLVLGAVTGAIFVGRASDLKDRCPNDQCAPEDEAEGDAVSTLGTVSTVGFIVAGVGAVAGTILLFTVPDDEQEPASPSAALRVGPAELRVEGRF